MSYIDVTPVIQKEWKPEPTQAQVIELPDTVFECLGGGAAGGGKTDLGLMIPPIRQFTEHPKFKGLIMRRTLTDLEKEIIPRQQEWYAPMGAVYNENKKVWKFPSGARIQNGHAEREQDVRKYDSAEYNYIDWDEVTHFTGFQYLYLSFSRCRSSSPDLPAFVRAFTNPGNVGHGFHKRRFVDPYPLGKRIIKDKVTKGKRIYIPFLGKDNKWLSINDPGYLNRLLSLTEQEKRAKLYGDWNSYEGQVFSEFRIARLPSDPENALHVISPFIIPSYWPRILAIDWGWAASTFVIWAAISPSGRVYIYRTYSIKKTLTKVWANTVVDMTGDEELTDCIICHSAGQHRGEEKTIQQQVNEAFEIYGYTFELAPKDRIGGKNLVHEYLRFEQLPTIRTPEVVYDGELANRILRIKGEDAYYQYLNMFIDTPPETNLPKLQIFERELGSSNEDKYMRELIDVIPSCIPAENNKEDVEEFDGDDPYDTLRMIVQVAHRYVDTAVDEQKKVKLYDKIINEVSTSANQTAFYLQMAKYEEETKELTSVRRHRRIGNGRYHH